MVTDVRLLEAGRSHAACPLDGMHSLSKAGALFSFAFTLCILVGFIVGFHQASPSVRLGCSWYVLFETDCAGSGFSKQAGLLASGVYIWRASVWMKLLPPLPLSLSFSFSTNLLPSTRAHWPAPLFLLLSPPTCCPAHAHTDPLFLFLRPIAAQHG